MHLYAVELGGRGYYCGLVFPAVGMVEIGLWDFIRCSHVLPVWDQVIESNLLGAVADVERRTFRVNL